MELKLFGLLSFGFSFGSWFGREMELENCFKYVMQSERGLFAMFVAIKKHGVKNARIFV